MRFFSRFSAALIAAGSFLCAAAAPLHATNFRFSRDSLAFANETVFHHGDLPVSAVGENNPNGKPYSRRCFVVCRAVKQFHKFARFEPRAAPPDDRTLAKLVRRITRRSVWMPALPDAERIVIPGYPDLRTLSARRIDVLQQNLGVGWPTYVRPGNFCFVFPPTPAQEKKTVAVMDAELARNELTILWLTKFPSLQMNHTVLVYGRTPQRNGDVIYTVYDPNYADKPRPLLYRPHNGGFSYAKTFYALGGALHARAVYRSPWQ